MEQTKQPNMNEVYLKKLEDARNLLKAHKETPQYKAEQEAKQKLNDKRIELISKFLAFGKKEGLSDRETGIIGYAVYLTTKNPINKE